MANTYKRIAVAAGGAAGTVNEYSQTFNATTDWTLNVSVYEITILESAHQQGITPVIQVEELDGTDYVQVDVNEIRIDNTGDITIQVTQNIDTRFAGRVTVLGAR